MLTAVAFVPATPLLLPEVASGASGELSGLRDACDRSLRTVLAGSDEAVLVGPDPVAQAPRPHGSGAVGDLLGFGVDVAVPLDPGSGGAAADGGRLPAALTVGAWLLARTGWPGPRRAVAVPASLSPQDCRDVGRAAAADAAAVRRLALVVVGDGSARRTEKAPGSFHADAQPYDAAVAAALAAVDTAALAALDPAADARLLVAGRPGWQVAAAAVDAAGGDWVGDLVADEAPYGVTYLVATWRRAGA